MDKREIMTREVSLVFPHQLFQNHPALNKRRRIFIIEDHLFFEQYDFHKQKLLLHRASMKFYQEYLRTNGYKVTYIESKDHKNLNDFFESNIAMEKIEKVHYCHPVDFLLEKNIRKAASNNKIQREVYDTPQFLLNNPQLQDEFMGPRDKYLMASFYQKQRKHFDILMDGDKPVGGKWSFDGENRNKMPKDHNPVAPSFPEENTYVKKAKDYVEKHYPNNQGDISTFNYPVTFNDADEMLQHFLEYRMFGFGKYQDAISPNEKFLYHSLLSSSINSGLLTPDQVLKITLMKHKDHNYPLNSLEGFVRQILGWREFMRLIYEKEGVTIRTENFFKFDQKIPQKLKDGETGIPPIDDCLKNNTTTAYNHHIERLMLLGNFMLLCEIDPDEVHQFFMERYIDAYDWVMVPNVYSMSQYADGGLITTKPYISGSNYVLKMSNYSKGDWCKVWDGLFWRFIFRQKEAIANNPRMSFMFATLNKMSKEKLEEHLNNANAFLEDFYQEGVVS